MKLTEDLNKLINTYHAFLQQCHDALAPTAKQADRNELRSAIEQLFKSHESGADKKPEPRG